MGPSDEEPDGEVPLVRQELPASDQAPAPSPQSPGGVVTLAEVAERLRTENRKARLVHDIVLAGGREEVIKAFEADPDFRVPQQLRAFVDMELDPRMVRADPDSEERRVLEWVHLRLDERIGGPLCGPTLRERVEALLNDVEGPYDPVGSPGPLYTMGVLADKKEFSRRLRELLKGNP